MVQREDAGSNPNEPVENGPDSVSTGGNSEGASAPEPDGAQQPVPQQGQPLQPQGQPYPPQQPQQQGQPYPPQQFPQQHGQAFPPHQHGQQPYPGPGSAPQQGAPTAPKRKMSQGKLVLLIGGIVVVAALLITGVFLGGRAILNQIGGGLGGGLGGGSNDAADLSAELLTPKQSNAFLDDRYADGVRELQIPSDTVLPLGFTSDRATMVVMRQLSIAAQKPTAWVAVDVDSGEPNREIEAAACSTLTPRDTLFCTVEELNEEIFEWEHEIREFDVASGEVVRTIPFSADISESLEYLGESDGRSIVISVTQNLGADTEAGLATTVNAYAIAPNEETFAWTYEFEQGADGDTVSACGLVEGDTLIACVGPSADDGDFETTMRAVDASTGAEVFAQQVQGSAYLTENAWFLAPTISDGMIEAGELPRMVEHDYAGEEIGLSERNALQPPPLVPTMTGYGLGQFVTYDAEVFKQASMTEHLLVNAEGEIVARTVPGTTAVLDSDIARESDGEVVFSGQPTAISANGQAVVYQEGGNFFGGTLVNMETGETMYDFEAGGYPPQLYVEQGIIVYSVDGGSTVLVPGA